MVWRTSSGRSLWSSPSPALTSLLGLGDPTARSKPSSAVLQRLAAALDITTEFLMNGVTAATAAQLSDKELLRQFQTVERLEPDDKHLVMIFIDAFITKRRL